MHAQDCQPWGPFVAGGCTCRLPVTVQGHVEVLDRGVAGEGEQEAQADREQGQQWTGLGATTPTADAAVHRCHTHHVAGEQRRLLLLILQLRLHTARVCDCAWACTWQCSSTNASRRHNYRLSRTR